MTNRELPTSPVCLSTRTALLAADHSSGEIQRRRRAGTLTSLRPGIYVQSDQYETQSDVERHRARARAAAISAPSSVVSHVSAAALHRLPLFQASLDTVHLTRPGTGGNVVRAGHHLHSGMLPDEQIVTIGRIRVTSVARTLVDLARTTGYVTGVVAADAALYLRGEITGPTAEILGRATHSVGVGAARRALRFADGRSESVGESRLRMFLDRLDLSGFGVGPCDLQIRIHDADGCLVARADLGYIVAGVLIEFDGKIKYGKLLESGQSPLQVLELEKQREDELRALGWQIVRVTWSDFANPALLERRIRDCLARARRAGGRASITGTAKAGTPIQLPR